MIKVYQLPDSPPLYLVFHCPKCHDDWSANRGDYFLYDPSEPLVCGECRQEMVLVTRRTTYDLEEGAQWLQPS